MMTSSPAAAALEEEVHEGSKRHLVTSTSPHPDIAFWRQRIREWYPRWRERTYFIPPVLMCRTLADTVQVSGQNVQVPQPPTSGPARKSRPSLLSSDVTEDQTQQRVLHCLHKLARAQRDVMFVLSQLRYEDYLSEPCFQAAARTLPRPVDLEKDGKHRGDFDLLIIHRQYGILVCEIKSVGAQFSLKPFTDQQKQDIVTGRLRIAVKQLEKSEEVLRHLTSDFFHPPRVLKSLILPNISASQLRKILMTCPQISQDLCRCLGIEASRDPVELCLTADRAPDAATPFDVNDDVICQLRQWWWARVTCNGADGAMSDSSYLELLARFSGPATTVRVFCALKPRLHMDLVRTEGEGVAETGRRFTQVTLTPQQLALQQSQEPLVLLTGPPGTGKSLMLVLKALQWLRQGRQVHVVSTWNQSLAMSFGIVHQLRRTVGAGLEGRVRLHRLDLVKGQAEVERGVALLVGAWEGSPGQPLCVLMDEACDGLGGQLRDLCEGLHTRLPPSTGCLHLWAACLHHHNPPPRLMGVPFTRPLRSPPSVTREVQRSFSVLGGSVRAYTAPAGPLPSDGLPTLQLWHSGAAHRQAREIRHCLQCGKEVARLLKRDLHVGVAVAGRPCHCPDPPLQFRDVFVLSYFALNDSNGIVRGLRREGVPVTVMAFGDSATTARVARAEIDEVVAAHLSFVSGLERKVVVCLQGERSEEGGMGQVYDEQYTRLHAMSRCTAQLVWVLLPEDSNG